jgi:hypothetical protein
MANGIKTGPIMSWVGAGIGLTLGVIATKTIINLVKGFVPLPIADL